jgi:anthranilate synthase component 2
MQCINEAFGGDTVRSTMPMHGKTSVIRHNGSRLFKDVPQNIKVARYHSLMIVNPSEEIEITASTGDRIPMALQHRQSPLFGVQFHPESFMTEYGDMIMKNFLEFIR